MDETKILSGKLIVQKGALKISTTLPEVGVKDVEPNGSWLEKKQIQAALDYRKQFIGVERIEKCGVLSHAEWREDLKLAEVTQKVGGYWQFLGHNVGKQLFLYPEEALFLMEVNCLLLKYGGIKVSLQQAYALLLQNNKELMQYKVYAALSRLGYRVYRHEMPKRVVESVILTDVSMEEDTATTVTNNKDIENEKAEKMQTETDISRDTDCQELFADTNQREKTEGPSSSTEILPKTRSRISKISKYVQNRINRLNSSRYKPKSKRMYAILDQFLDLPDFTKHPEAIVKPPPIDFVPGSIGFSRLSYHVNVEKIHKNTRLISSSSETSDNSSNSTNATSYRGNNSNSDLNFNTSRFPMFPQTLTRPSFNLWNMQLQHHIECFNTILYGLFPRCYLTPFQANKQSSSRRSKQLAFPPPFQLPTQPPNFLFNQPLYHPPNLLMNRLPYLPPNQVNNLPLHLQAFPVANNLPIYQPPSQSADQAHQHNQETNPLTDQPTSQSSNTDANAGDRARKRAREKSKKEHLDKIQRWATKIRKSIIELKMPSYEILELKGFIDKFNTEYDARVRLSNDFTVSYTENIVDLVVLDDDGEEPAKKFKDDDKLHRLKQLAERLKDLQGKNEDTTRHRKALEKLIQRYNKTYNVKYYLNADSYLIEKNEFNSQVSNSGNNVSEPSTSKMLKNPFSILKQLSEKQYKNTNNTKKNEDEAATSSASEIVYAYSRFIEDTFSENWLPPESYFGRPEIISKNDAKYSLDLTKEELMMDFVKIQPQRFNNWFEVKMAFFQCLLKTSELLSSENVQIEKKEVKNGTMSSLLNPKDFGDSATMLEKLAIIKNNKEISPSTTIMVDFDVYNRNVQSFRKSNRPSPHFRIVCLRESSSLPTGADISSLHSKYKDNITILFAIVGSGSISYLQVNPADIPVYLSVNKYDKDVV